MAGRKLKLESSSPDEITLIGISSTMEDYRLIHYLNKALRIDFVKIPELTYFVTPSRELTVPLYHYFHNATENNWLILSNKSASNEFIIPQHKNLDFFLIIDNLIDEEEASELVRKLRQVKGISLALMLSTDKLAKIDLLFADLEMHLMDVYGKSN